MAAVIVVQNVFRLCLDRGWGKTPAANVQSHNYNMILSLSVSTYFPVHVVFPTNTSECM